MHTNAQTQAEARGVATALILFVLWLLLLPIGNAGDAIVAAMGVCWLLWRWGGSLRMVQTNKALAAERCFGGLFVCIWLPMLLSTLLAAPPKPALASENWEAVGKLLRFLAAGMFWTFALQFVAVRVWLGPIALLFVAMWSLDGLIQALVGTGLLGPSAQPGLPDAWFENVGRFGHAIAVLGAVGVGWGLFGSRELPVAPSVQRLGAALGVQRPLAWAVRHKQALAWVVWGLVWLALLVASRRGAMLMVAVWSALFVFCWWRQAGALARRGAVVVAVLLVLVGGVLVWQLPKLNQRVQQTAQLFEGDAEAIDSALTGRWSMWTVAVRMVEDRPVFGVGPGQFRHAYPLYADADDPWVVSRRNKQWRAMDKKEKQALGHKANLVPDSGANHAHQYVLGVLAETGLVGGLGLLTACWVMWRWVKQVGWPQPAALGLVGMGLAAWFPINTHAHFAGGFWGGLCWVGLAMAIGAMAFGSKDRCWHGDGKPAKMGPDAAADVAGCERSDQGL